MSHAPTTLKSDRSVKTQYAIVIPPIINIEHTSFKDSFRNTKKLNKLIKQQKSIINVPSTKQRL